MKALYVRVSSLDQHTDRQKIDTTGFQVFEDKCPGSVPFALRPAGKRVMKALQAGELERLEVHSLDRLGRDLRDILDTINHFDLAGVPIHVRKECLTTINSNGHPNVTTRMILSILGSLAEMEKSFIRERQLEGIAQAKARGVYLGRKPGTVENTAKFLSKKKTQKILTLMARGLSGREIQRVTKCSPNTISKVKKLAGMMSKLEPATTPENTA